MAKSHNLIPKRPVLHVVNNYHWDLVEKIDKADCEVNKWESEFLESLLHKSDGFLSPKQKVVIDKIAEKYGIG